MANFMVTPYAAAVLENTKLDIQSLYLHRIISGPNKNQYTVIDGYGNTDFCLTSVNNWAIYDGAGQDAKLVARAKGMRMNAVDWCNFFTIVFEMERFKGSTLEVMGATTSEEQGEWAIVGGTGEFAMARGVIKRKLHQKVADGEVLELSVDAFCRIKIDLGPTEFVKEVSGTYGSYDGRAMTAMWSLKLVTNLRTIGPYGSSQGTSFTFSAPPNNRIAGFFGSSEPYSLNAIGAYTVENSA